MEGFVGMMEMILNDPAGGFLLAFRLKNQPGHPIVQLNIPYLVVDDHGATIGELTGHSTGIVGRSYELWSQGVPYLTVPAASGSKPYAVLQRGTPVAEVVEQKSIFTKMEQKKWIVHFTAPCDHLHVVALLASVAGNRGGTGIPMR